MSLLEPGLPVVAQLELPGLTPDQRALADMMRARGRERRTGSCEVPEEDIVIDQMPFVVQLRHRRWLAVDGSPLFYEKDDCSSP